MKLDYGMQLSPYHIELSIGTIKKPKLKDIAQITFDKFAYYETLIKMSPEFFYTKIKGDGGKQYWETLSDKEKEDLSLYKIAINDQQLIGAYLEIFNFFFEENVIFKDGYFLLLNKGKDSDTDITPSDIRGAISDNTFPQVLNLLQQICCINDKEDEVIDEKQFKNGLAKKLYEKMQRAAKKQREQRKNDVNLTIPNIISAVSNKHSSINPINVWELTVFQLLDAFNRIQLNSAYEMDRTRVSVWGDEKKTYDPALWYKNEFDKNN